MSNQYDVLMIGAGPSAIFCAYELKRNKPDMKVLMIEKGRRIEKRACPKRNTKAVSYTHLDVYKRQDYRSTIPNLQLQRSNAAVR